MHLFKRWLNRNFRDGTVYAMNVKYVLWHLNPYDKRKLGASWSERERIWQDAKAVSVMKEMEAGKDPLRFPPIRLVLHESKDEFKVEDGISRLKAFRKKRIKKIPVSLRLGKW